jgi:hypothetical protein
VLRAAVVLAIASLAALTASTHVRAVASSETATYDPSSQTYSYTYTYSTGAPAGVTGWNYVGQTDNASAVYLGDGYVLTAGHVGAGTSFTLDGQTYDTISNSSESIGTADLTLFKIDTTSTTGNVLSLPTLSLDTTVPSVGTSVVMIGYGNSEGERWATNTVNENNQSVPEDSFTSTDFFTVDSFSNDGPNTTTTTNGQLVPGDSGGGDFIYNSSTEEWQLAGINEVLLENNSGKISGSGMIQIGDYATTIQADMAPEPSPWQLVLGGLGMLGVIRIARRRGALSL